jgi:hypothetical protein
MSNTPITFYASLYCNGLQVSNNATTPNTKIDVAAGACRDNSNTIDITLTAGTIDATVNGANGLDTGDLANSTKYAVYAIGSSTNSAQPALLLSASFSSPLLPDGYDKFQRIGMVKTDGSANFLKFYRSGNGMVRYHQWDTPVAVLAATTQTSFTAQSLAAAMTLQATPAYLSAVYTPNNAANTAQLRPTGSSVAEDSAPIIISGAVGSVAMKTAPFKVLPQLSSGNPSVDWLVQASDTLALNVVAFDDAL